MPLPPAFTKNSLYYALNQIQSTAAVIKSRAADAVTIMTAGSVNTTFIFSLLDDLNQAMAALNAVKNTAGLDAYATAQVSGYSGTMSTECNTTVAAAQVCLDWVVANFPTAATWIQAEQINSDGTRTLRAFTPAQTAGLRTNLNSLLATIG